jgi:hypothetical protein
MQSAFEILRLLHCLFKNTTIPQNPRELKCIIFRPMQPESALIAGEMPTFLDTAENVDFLAELFGKGSLQVSVNKPSLIVRTLPDIACQGLPR